MRTTGLFAFLCVFALALSTVAFAKAKNEGSFDLAQAASFGSVQLHPGHYKAEWTGGHGIVEVSVMQNGKTVATTKAELRELASPAGYTAVTLRATPSHHERIEEIQFNNHREALFLSARAS
jgi:hypothetical protein